MGKIIKIPSAFVYETKVAGVSKVNDDGFSRQEIIRREVDEGDELVLQPDDDNPYDPNAVSVFTKSHKQVGFLTREMAEKIRPALLNEVDVRVIVRWVSGEKIVGVGLRIELVN